MPVPGEPAALLVVRESGKSFRSQSIFFHCTANTLVGSSTRFARDLRNSKYRIAPTFADTEMGHVPYPLEVVIVVAAVDWRKLAVSLLMLL
jgi:hypothetical protein